MCRVIFACKSVKETEVQKCWKRFIQSEYLKDFFSICGPHDQKNLRCKTITLKCKNCQSLVTSQSLLWLSLVTFMFISSLFGFDLNGETSQHMFHCNNIHMFVLLWLGDILLLRVQYLMVWVSDCHSDAEMRSVGECLQIPRLQQEVT